MTVRLNHTILAAVHRRDSAEFLAGVLGLPEPVEYGPFSVLRLGNDVTLDVLETPGPITAQHYAFLADEAEFDGIFGRIQERGLPYWADPFHDQPGRINRWHGGRGVYFEDLNGHSIEVLTQPYAIDR